MSAPWPIPFPGPAADFATRLGARFVGTADWDTDPEPAEIRRHAPSEDP
jgi:hypothetical protein